MFSGGQLLSTSELNGELFSSSPVAASVAAEGEGEGEGGLGEDCSVFTFKQQLRQWPAVGPGLPSRHRHRVDRSRDLAASTHSLGGFNIKTHIYVHCIHLAQDQNVSNMLLRNHMDTHTRTQTHTSWITGGPSDTVRPECIRTSEGAGTGT